jgi:hypothetical protein
MTISGDENRREYSELEAFFSLLFIKSVNISKNYRINYIYYRTNNNYNITIKTLLKRFIIDFNRY